MKIINLGMGRQSTALYLLSSRGDIPRADHAIFADTQHESEGTYTFIRDHLMPWAAANNGIPIHTVKTPTTLMDAMRDPEKGQKIPAFVKSPDGSMGQLKRTCTHRFKIMPIQAKIRELMSLGKTGKFPPFEQWFGINVHEMERALKMPTIAACTFVYPMLSLWSRRGNPILTKPDLFGNGGERPRDANGKVMPLRYEIAWGKMDWRATYPDEKLPALYAEFGLPTPPHSSCVFCPFQSPARWKQTRNNPTDWAMALKADEALKGQQGVLRGEAFLLRSGKRLAEMDEPTESTAFFDGCEGGYCGV
jgi:hypothetical protein